jgi:hypothetical protein
MLQQCNTNLLARRACAQLGLGAVTIHNDFAPTTYARLPSLHGRKHLSCSYRRFLVEVVALNVADVVRFADEVAKAG